MRQLVLIGAGHAHVEVIRLFSEEPIENTELCVISPDDLTPYSGMIPGVIAGIYRRDEAYIDVRKICNAPNIKFIKAEAISIAPTKQTVLLSSGDIIHYNVCSINTGVTPDSSLINDGTRVTPVKPIDTFYQDWQQKREYYKNNTNLHHVYVVGGGAASCEIAATLKWQVDDLNPHNQIKWHVIAPKNILPEYHKNVRGKVLRYFQTNDIEIIEHYVQKVDEKSLTLDNLQIIKADWIIWALPGVASPLIKNSELEHSDKGELIVNKYLNAMNHPNIFGAGDCISFKPRSLRKTGVYPVHQAPILDKNIRQFLSGEQRLTPFKPRMTLLNILLLNPKSAILSFGALVLKGGYVQKLKSRIDLKFMRRY